MANHPAPPLVISESELSRSSRAHAGRADRAAHRDQRPGLSCARPRAGRTASIAEELGLSPMTVLLWRRRFKEHRPRRPAPTRPDPGRPPTYGREDRDRVIALTLEQPPEGRPTGAPGELAKRIGHEPHHGPAASGGSAGLKPHRTETFKFSTDPDLDGQDPRRRRACTSTRPSGRSCSASTRRPRSRRSTGPSRCCPCGPGRSSGTPMTTSGTARPACSRRSRWAPAR